MAGQPVVWVKQAWAEALRPLMPALNDPVDGSPGSVPVDYMWPGSAMVQRVHVWFEGDTTTSEVHSLRQGRRRRRQTTEFRVICQALVDRPAEGHGSDSELQALCDQIVYDLADIIDTHIADDEHMASAALVDVAQYLGHDLESGPLPDGVGSRLTCRVSFQTRIL